MRIDTQYEILISGMPSEWIAPTASPNEGLVIVANSGSSYLRRFIAWRTVYGLLAGAGEYLEI
jgi:hypothetical protein